MKTAKGFLLAALACVLAPPPAARAVGTTLSLNTAFVKKVKDKATLTTSLFVDKHPDGPHTISEGAEDSDIHTVRDLEGKRVETRGWQDAAAARALIGESQRSYADQQKRAAGKAG